MKCCFQWDLTISFHCLILLFIIFAFPALLFGSLLVSNVSFIVACLEWILSFVGIPVSLFYMFHVDEQSLVLNFAASRRNVLTNFKFNLIVIICLAGAIFPSDFHHWEFANRPCETVCTNYSILVLRIYFCHLSFVNFKRSIFFFGELRFIVPFNFYILQSYLWICKLTCNN